MKYLGIMDNYKGNYGVCFPDIPGCVGVGKTPEEAIENASSALHEIYKYKTLNGFEMPKPLTSAQDKEILNNYNYPEAEIVYVELKTTNNF